MIWFALFIPFIASYIAYKKFSHKMAVWEYLIPTAISFLFIFFFKLILSYSQTHDKQYLGSLIVEARYYEPWSTWVTQTCTREVACGQDCTTDSKGSTTCTTKYCTETYDCSYCDDNSAYWKAYDDHGHSWTISEKQYNELKTRWNSTPKFIELNRNIDYHGGCGKDGDAYSIKWDRKIETSEASVTEESYENKTQSAKSYFSLENISSKEAKKLKLYEYPILYNHYKQNLILGLDSLNFHSNEKDFIQRKYEYFNGYNGPIKKVKVFILLFFDQSQEIGFKQQSYWDGGNKNELVICIDINKQTKKINWVYPFSWTDNKKILVDARENIALLDTLNFDRLYDPLTKTIENFKYKDFRDYNYITLDPPTWAIWVTYITTLLLTIGSIWWSVINEYDEN